MDMTQGELDAPLGVSDQIVTRWKKALEEVPILRT
jgi:hypothetical protein